MYVDVLFSFWCDIIVKDVVFFGIKNGDIILKKVGGRKKNLYYFKYVHNDRSILLLKYEYNIYITI